MLSASACGVLPADQLAIAWEFRDELVVILRTLVSFVLLAVKPTGTKQFQATHG